MEKRILGLHHITAIAGRAQQNYDFYTKVLGLRLVKKTVNFDDPGTYHFYFGDTVGSPGNILTFFPWEGISQGKIGTGMATEIDYSAPEGSLEFWMERFEGYQVKHRGISERFGERLLPFYDPDGLQINLVVPKNDDTRLPWETTEVSKAEGLKGFHNVTLMLNEIEPTAAILTDIFGYKLQGQEDNRYRFITDAVDNAAIIDLLEVKGGQRGYNAAGTNHHIAFRVKDDSVLMEYREKILEQGFNITPKIDRNYFFSLYFREPGGVLFELATDNPGFDADETVEELGSSLKLPPQYESRRTEIEGVLPVIE